MKFQPHFLRFITLPTASLLLIIATAVLHPACANELQAESDAERYVLEQFQNGADVAFDQFPSDKRQLRASFIAALLTNRIANLKINSGGIKIISAVIVGTLDLRGQEIPYDVYLSRCTFDDVDLSDAHFAKSLRLIKATFTGMALFDR